MKRYICSILPLLLPVQIVSATQPVASGQIVVGQEVEETPEQLLSIVNRILGVDGLNDPYGSAKDLESSEQRMELIHESLSSFEWEQAAALVMQSRVRSYMQASESEQRVACTLLVTLLNAAGDLRYEDAVVPLSMEYAIAQNTVRTEHGVMLRGGKLLSSTVDQDKLRQYRALNKMKVPLALWLVTSLTGLSVEEQRDWLKNVGINLDAAYLDVTRRLIDLPVE